MTETKHKHQWNEMIPGYCLVCKQPRGWHGIVDEVACIDPTTDLTLICLDSPDTDEVKTFFMGTFETKKRGE